MIFSKGDKADFAYLVLQGEIGFYQHDFANCKKNHFLKKAGQKLVLQDDASFFGTRQYSSKYN